MDNIVLFGGTFNPIHNLHIKIALDACEHFKFSRIDLLPCFIPVHKTTTLCSKHRIEMLKIAIKNHKNLSLNLTEISRATPSYMIDTLRDIKSNNHNSTIYLIIGSDSLNNLHKWKEWQGILSKANIIVAKRRGYEIDPIPEVSSKITQSIHNNQIGNIYILPKIYDDVSSSNIRNNISVNEDKNINNDVFNYIKNHSIYS